MTFVPVPNTRVEVDVFNNDTWQPGTVIGTVSPIVQGEIRVLLTENPVHHVWYGPVDQVRSIMTGERGGDPGV